MLEPLTWLWSVTGLVEYTAESLGLVFGESRLAVASNGRWHALKLRREFIIMNLETSNLNLLVKSRFPGGKLLLKWQELRLIKVSRRALLCDEIGPLRIWKLTTEYQRVKQVW